MISVTKLLYTKRASRLCLKKLQMVENLLSRYQA